MARRTQGNKGNAVFRKVLKGTKENQKPTPKEAEALARRARSVERTKKQLEADSRALRVELDRREREEAAHIKAELERRNNRG